MCARAFVVALASSALVACSSGSDPAGDAPMGAGDDAATPTGPAAASGDDDGGGTAAAGSGPSAPPTMAGDAGKDAAPAPVCKKHITVVFAVGTGSSEVAAHSNGCWTKVDADGAANHQFRKCSTSSYVVQNASAPNYAFDDTNPTVSLSMQQNFLSQCSSGASGDGYEYMAYRAGSWRLLTAPHMRAWFAELYSSDATIADYYGYWQTSIGGHPVSPMINFGPHDPATIESAASKMCNRVSDGGYFGAYDGDWPSGMSATDARAIALAKALDACTAP